MIRIDRRRRPRVPTLTTGVSSNYPSRFLSPPGLHVATASCRFDTRGRFTLFTLWRMLPVRGLILKQLPQLFAALVIAELFYKFHSFLLEAIAFLVTWFIIGALVEFIPSLRARRHDAEVGDRPHAEATD